MPSDERVPRIHEALAAQRVTFRTMVEATVADVRSYLSTSPAAQDGHEERLAAELGPFGSERLDVRRFATLFAKPQSLDKMTAETVEKALKTLAKLAAREEDLFVTETGPGGNLRKAVSKSLGEIGRVFGAARIVERIRSRRYRYSEHARAFGSFPFSEWTRAERRLVPPLVVLVDGRDLNAIELAEFLDGAMKLILVVRGDAAPAPLVRLITPQTFVMQTTDAGDVQRIVAWDGPGILALVPDAAARFLHDPAGGSEIWQRMTVTQVPEAEPRKAVGTSSAAQQAEELRQLRALGKKPSAVETVRPMASVGAAEGAPRPVGAAKSEEPVDKLAAWLLDQADLSNLDSS
jgi:hypothetical protein